MTKTPLDFAALVGSRICHDLISPIGAINNGMELLGMSGLAPSPEMALISESVEAANARIRFFRVAYGTSNAQQVIGRKEIVSILQDVTKGSRLSMRWEPLDDVARIEAQIAFLAIQCAETAMPYGGSIAVAQDKGLWALHMIADRFSFDDDLWGRLRGDGQANAIDEAELRPAHVQFALLPMLLATTGRSPSVSDTTKGAILFA